MKYVVWGAGVLLTEFSNIVNTETIEAVDYFVDSDKNKWGMEYWGKQVNSPQTLLSEDKNNIMVIVGVYEAHADIELLLRKMGFEEAKNYIWAVKFTGNETVPGLFKRKIWKDNEIGCFTNESFVLRTEIALELVNWDGIESMLDLGAGMMRAKDYIPNGVAYIPVDYKKRAPETVICDFNKYEFPSHTADLVYAIGVIGYVKDWKWFLGKMADAVNEGGSLVISTLTLNKYQAFCTAHVSFMFECEVILFLQKLGLVFIDFADWRTKTRILHLKKPKH